MPSAYTIEHSHKKIVTVNFTNEPPPKSVYRRQPPSVPEGDHTLNYS